MQDEPPVDNGEEDKKDQKIGEVVSSEEFLARRRLDNEARQKAAKSARRTQESQAKADAFLVRQQHTEVQLLVEGQTAKFLEKNARDIRSEIDGAQHRPDKRAYLRDLGSSAKVLSRIAGDAPVLTSYFGDAGSSTEGIAKRKILKNWIGNKYGNVEGDDWPILVDFSPDHLIYIEWQPKEPDAA